MIEFILNDALVRTGLPPGLPLLDFIRQDSGLTGTKTGCREGDCGACTVLLGELIDGAVSYHTIVSCLTPLGNVHGKHVVTIEGLNREEMTPVQQAIADHSATQCGFCTPGFVVSLTGFLLSGDFSDRDNIIAAIDGNICRCTGYKAIEKAAFSVFDLVPEEGRNNIPWLISCKFLPDYFASIPEKLARITSQEFSSFRHGVSLGGGTDMMVQRADELRNTPLNFLNYSDGLKQVILDKDTLRIGGQVTVTQLAESGEIRSLFPRLKEHVRLISSTPVRNMATIAGNIVNASPIADLVIFLLALDANIVLQNQQGTTREVKLNQFYSGYKKLDRREDEMILEVNFRIPSHEHRFNFEKVSKRQHLDIASVNSAMLIRMKGNHIGDIHLSAGGVAPVPLYLGETCRFLAGNELTPALLQKAMPVLQAEISPISDIRGTDSYKRLLLRQLFIAHFMELFPGLIGPKHLEPINTDYEKQ